MRSNFRRPLAIAGALSILGGPAAIAIADDNSASSGQAQNPNQSQTTPSQTTEQQQAAAAAEQRRRAHKRKQVRRAVRLQRSVRRLEGGRRVRTGYAAALNTWPITRVYGRIRTLQRELRVLRRYRVPSGMRGVLRRIAWCESKGNPRAIGGGGAFRGKYQFMFSTWRAMGGKGDPARASEREQDYRAAKLLRTGGRSHWPVCG